MHDVEVTERIIGERNKKAKEREGHQEHHGTALLFVVPDSCRLRCTFAGICSIPDQRPSAAGWDSATGTMPDTDARSSRPAEDPDSLPPLEELFGDFQSDDYIERLEELAESLLREVTAEVEAHPHRSNEQVSFGTHSRTV